MSASSIWRWSSPTCSRTVSPNWSLQILDSGARTAFVETLTQLHEVFFVSTTRTGRQILGHQSGIPISETIFNRSFPIKAMAPTFERLHRDPRPIAQDLRHAFVGTFDPRFMFQTWQRLLEKWDVSPPQIEYRFYLAFTPISQGDQIYDRESAKRWLQKEDDAWRNISRGGSAESSQDKAQDKKNIKWPVGASSENFQDEDLEKAVKPAFGFWLFDVDTLGDLSEVRLGKDEAFLPEPEQMLNMTEQWPELALLSLP